MKDSDYINEAIEIVKHMFSNITNFDGVEKRRDFWIFYLVLLIPSLIIKIPFVISILLGIVTLSAGVRRLHDTDKSGWWALLMLIPVLGWIGYFFLLAMPSVENSRWANK